jgi:Cysteine-rich secretory protein family
MPIPDLPQTAFAIVEMTNDFRQENGRAKVRPNPTLAAAAQAFADYLAQSGKFAHDADGRQPADRVKAAGYRFCLIAENLAAHLDSRGFTTVQLAREAIAGWKDSPRHRQNLLAPFVTEIGIGVAHARATYPKYIVAQLFGRPAALQYRFHIENKTGTTISYSLNGTAHILAPEIRVTHTACTPVAIAFDRAGSEPAGSINGRFAARDGSVFRLQRDAVGMIRVAVENSQR